MQMGKIGKSRVRKETRNSITIYEGDGYYLRASRARIGAFTIVAVDWQHPNYGYFADAMLWYFAPHFGEWQPIPIARWATRYEVLKQFLKDYPEFWSLFTLNATDKFGGLFKAFTSELRKKLTEEERK
jgi:hypothetical protein